MTTRLAAGVIRLVTGATVRWMAPAPAAGGVVYFANHTSHLDTLVLWASLPFDARRKVRPVAAGDYWGKTALRRFLAERVFRALLIERKDINRDSNPLPAMLKALDAGESLIVFPEGTRGDGEKIGPFKSGLHHLASARPHVAFVPIYLDNMNRILPKGELLPIPMLSRVTLGEALHLAAHETRAEFLQRAEDAVRRLRSE